MLKERVITALILLPIVLWCVFFRNDSLAFAALAASIVLVGAWEWTRMMGWHAWLPRSVFVAVVAALIAAFQFWPSAAMDWHLPLFSMAVFFWLLALRLVSLYPAAAGFWGRPLVLLPVGLLLLLPAWVALVQLHEISPWWLLYVFLLVWGADTGAYFAGRAFGKTKLAPAVSPAKTIEGLFGGLALTMAIMLGVGFYLGLPGLRFVAFAGLSLLTVLASVLGDLLESMVKRHAGIKDSGNIFPGHGGAMDRIDSLTAAAPVFMLGWLLAGGF